ncbi:MAG: hypothetical protein M2R45_05239 [Verrucomicrobia subdivision 3 bacterium]|nr:hypothetical protein [Limisphaerales bacterium]MCS1417799.1 hypothetical protein [Limisphaerales bacterium]
MSSSFGLEVGFGGGRLLNRGTHSPFVCHDLVKRGTLFRKMEIDDFEGVEMSRG